MENEPPASGEKQQSILRAALARSALSGSSGDLPPTAEELPPESLNYAEAYEFIRLNQFNIRPENFWQTLEFLDRTLKVRQGAKLLQPAPQDQYDYEQVPLHIRSSLSGAEASDYARRERRFLQQNAGTVMNIEALDSLLKMDKAITGALVPARHFYIIAEGLSKLAKDKLLGQQNRQLEQEDD